MTAIPRSVVATALLVDEAALPEGDLPITRLAERYHRFLATDENRRMDSEDAWTFDLMSDLVQTQPALAFEAILQTLALCADAEQVSYLAAGPMEDLLVDHGTDFIAPVEQQAKLSARVRFLLSGVWKRDMNPMLWARIEAARAPGPDMDAGDPLPETERNQRFP